MQGLERFIKHTKAGAMHKQWRQACCSSVLALQILLLVLMFITF